MADGAWLEMLTVELHAYDAGTDSGAIYDAPNSPTEPRAPVFRITASPFEQSRRLGTFTFSRQ